MAGGPYNIPRNTKGEGRFFNIFSTKALIATILLGLIGVVIAYIISIFILIFNPKFPTTIALIVGAIAFGAIGFVITSFKIPESNNFEVTRKAGGEYIYQIIFRFIKFKKKKNRIYTFFTEEKKHE